MADLKPVYLIHGEDDARIDAWRTRLRSRAERENGPGGIEVFHAGTDSADEVVASLAALTFATGTRYLLVEDAGAWKAAAAEPLVGALGAIPPDTVLMIVVRGKALAGLVKATKAAGGEVKELPAPKPWELVGWTREQAEAHGLSLDAEGAKALVALAGPGQQRLVREIEKLSIALHPESRAGAEDVALLAAGESTTRVYDLADALVAGDLEATIRLAEDLAGRDEEPSRFVYPIVSRLREVQRVVELLDAGVGEKDLAKAMRVPPWRVKKAVALARRADRETLRSAICRFADLEVELRGGGTLDEETAVTLTLARAAA